MRVIVPSSFTPERQYIVEWLLRDRLGLSVEITTDATRNATHLVAGERELVIEDGLFAADEASWPLASCLPNEPLAVWDPRAHGLDAADGHLAQGFGAARETRCFDKGCAPGQALHLI